MRINNLIKVRQRTNNSLLTPIKNTEFQYLDAILSS
jgi:hypothetical protein